MSAYQRVKHAALSRRRTDGFALQTTGWARRASGNGEETQGGSRQRLWYSWVTPTGFACLAAFIAACWQGHHCHGGASDGDCRWALTLAQTRDDRLGRVRTGLRFTELHGRAQSAKPTGRRGDGLGTQRGEYISY